MIPGRTIVKWAAGAESVAALLARCTSAGRTPLAASASTAARKRSTCARAEAVSTASAEDGDRPPPPRPPELHAFLDRGDAERGGPGLSEGARRGDGAVPVPVGLHHRQHLHGRTDEVPGGAEIRAQRPEAHLGDRGSTLDFEHEEGARERFLHIKCPVGLSRTEAVVSSV